MVKDERRITLVVRTKSADRTWRASSNSGTRIVVIDSMTLLRSTIASPLVRSDSDVERLILDRCCDHGEFLSLLAAMPQEFTGDVLMIHEDKSFLSAMGRGGDRIVYALSAEDVQFYLEVARLVEPTEAMERHVLKFRPRVVDSVSVARTSAASAKPLRARDSRVEKPSE